MSMVRLVRLLSHPRRVLALAGTLIALGWAAPALADREMVTITNPAALRFGSFAVPTTGYREVSTAGAISEAGIFAVSNTGVGPASFIVEYDRGNNSRNRLDITVDLVFSSPQPFANGTMTVQLSRYQTDLPGYGLIQPGQTVTVRIPNCTQRKCSTSFSLGGRIDIDRRSGGGAVTIAVPVSAVFTSVR